MSIKGSMSIEGSLSTSSMSIELSLSTQGSCSSRAGTGVAGTHFQYQISENLKILLKKIKCRADFWYIHYFKVWSCLLVRSRELQVSCRRVKQTLGCLLEIRVPKLRCTLETCIVNVCPLVNLLTIVQTLGRQKSRPSAQLVAMLYARCSMLGWGASASIANVSSSLQLCTWNEYTR